MIVISPLWSTNESHWAGSPSQHCPLTTQPSFLHDLLNRLVSGISCVASNGSESHLSKQVHLRWRKTEEKRTSRNKWLPPWSQLATNLPLTTFWKAVAQTGHWNPYISNETVIVPLRLICLADSNTGKLDVPVKSGQKNKRQRKETQVWKLSLSAASCVRLPLGLISVTVEEN